MITGAPAPSPTFLGSDSFLLCGRRRLRLRLPVRGLTRWGERLRWPPEPSYFPSCGRLAFGCGSPYVPRLSPWGSLGSDRPDSRTSYRVVASPSAAAPRTSLASHPGAALAVTVRPLALPIAWSPRLRLRLPLRPSPLTLGRHRQWASALSHFLSRGRLAFGCGSPYVPRLSPWGGIGRGRPHSRTSYRVVASPSAAAPRTSLASHPGAASA